MRTLFLFSFLFFSTLFYGQDNYQIITLDSITSTGGAQGVYGLTAETYGGNIHLTYIYGSVDEEWFLMYEIRNNGDQLLKEVAHQFSQGVLVSPETAIQFDADGDPHIYCAGVSGGQAFITITSRKNGVWSLAPFSYNNRVHLNATKDGSEYLGFVTKSGISPYSISYASNIDGAWGVNTLSQGGLPTSEGAALSLGKEEYVAYLEHHDPDTSVLLIYKRIDQGPWTLDFEESVLQPVPWGSFDARWCMFGLDAGTPHLIHTMHSEGFNALMTHMVRVNGTWENKSSGHLDSYGNERSHCNALEFDDEGNLYTAWLRDNVWWINSQEESSSFAVAGEGAAYEYYDIAILGTDIYQYFIAGNKDWPFGDPLVFYEAKGSLATLTDLDDLAEMTINKAQVYPNPAKDFIILELDSDKPQDLFISWTDALGRKLNKNSRLNTVAGQNSINLSIHDFSAGLYYLRIYNEKGQLTLPVVVK